MKNDTIAAVSTPLGSGGIGIIRISGPQAFDIAENLFSGKKTVQSMRSHTLNYGRIVDPSTQQMIDEVLLAKMNAPHTFTKEDVVEIHCHGGLIVLRKVLEQIIKLGARPAEPGEFTKRAFLNGRLDLSQAEAVIDVICAKTEEGSRAAVQQLEGKLSEQIRNMRGLLIALLAHVDACVDYPEYDIEEITTDKIRQDIGNVLIQLRDTIKSFERGRILREGIQIVIAGKPNVGKSSLLNALARVNRAIVTDIPGTTRDVLEEYINLGGVPAKVTDTAGIRETDDPVEKIGVEKAQRALQTADLVFCMLDASQPLTDEDRRVLETTSEKRRFVIINKVDTVGQEALLSMENELQEFEVFRMSIKNNKGIEQLEQAVASLFTSGEVEGNTEVLVTNIRHKNLLEQAEGSLVKVLHDLEQEMPVDCLAIDLRDAADFLGQITGESVREDVMAEIFSRFCIGK